jgi:hypothetical protein
MRGERVTAEGHGSVCGRNRVPGFYTRDGIKITKTNTPPLAEILAARVAAVGEPFGSHFETNVLRAATV